jgi:hypothetical protein
MRNPRKNKIKVRPNFALVVDGDTEVWYFQMLKRNERTLAVNIEPRIPQKKSILEQFELVKSLSEDYKTVFWIIDFDTIIKETREVKRGSETPLQAFLRYRKIIKKEYDNITIIVNNPCLEFWILLHFERTSKYFNNCASAEKQLKKHLKDYEKTRKYYTKQGNDIYLKLKPNLKTAISNSSLLGSFNGADFEKAVCEMKLFYNDNGFNKHFEL